MRQYDGGYYLVADDLIRSGINHHTSSVADALSDETLAAVNVIQDVPWRVNTAILDLMRETWVSGGMLGGLPRAHNEPLPERLSEAAWEAMDRETKAEHKRRLSEIHGRNARAQAGRQSFLSKLSIAEEMRGRESIYFPHFVDFRGRIYPMTQDLHPQGDDVAKALLMFARGKAIGRRGIFWLGVRLANTFGEDKLALKDRVEWALDHAEEIADSADDPLDGRQFWTKADEPWSFLATCLEWNEALAQIDSPENFVSHLPIPLDGSCNGLQHLSAMGRDQVGARATNLKPNAKREDIYLEVAEVVKRLVSDDAVMGVEEAHEWVGKITRKTVKRAVMTTPYGVTERGIRDQLVADGHAEGVEDRGAAAEYLKDKIVAGLSSTVSSAKDIMAWFQAVAKKLAEHDIPFRWTTPTGNVIQQSYYNLARKKVSTLIGEMILWEEDKVVGLNARKQTLASAPNVIHSFDAAHLVRTTNQMVAHLPDVSLAMIHDSFGTHAADTDLLNRILRSEFVRIYQEDWLQRIEDEVRSYAPDVDIPSYRDHVTLGDFDVNEVLQAEFFFA